MASAAAAAAAAPLFELGLIADCQHGDKPAANGRTYRESLHRLALAVEHLNEFDDLHAVLHLGDVIDGRETLDDSLQDLSNVLGVMQRLHPRLHEKVLHAVGNHDLAVPRAQLGEALGLADSGTFFSTAVRGAVGWRIVMLDTYQVSTSWVKQGRQPPSIAADRWLEEHAERPNALDWNGAVGEEQRQWLSETLDAAGSVGDRVLVFGHSPLLPGASDAVHCAWDGAETAAILDAHECVQAYFSGHDHRGGYCCSDGGVHHITVAGMVQSPLDSNAYAVLRVYGDRLVVDGLGTMVVSHAGLRLRQPLSEIDAETSAAARLRSKL